MKRSIWVLSIAASWMLATSVIAQQLRQPTSVRPAAYSHGYYAYQEEASPSDQPSPPADSPPTPPGQDTGVEKTENGQQATDPQASGSDGCGGTTACDPCCTSCCDPRGCGCGGSLCDLLFPCCRCPGEEAWTLFPQDNSLGIKIAGWSQTGYHNRNNGLFNSHPGKLRQNQTWLYVEREADGSNGLDVGFRADVVYGVDAQDTQAFGNPPGTWDFFNGFDHGIYGWALPQMYAEIASGDWSIIGGHFFTIVGYEVVTAPDNFFYSHSLTMNNSEPFTHTGILGTYSLTDDIEIYAGWTLGWDTGFEQLGDGSNFLGGFSAPLTDFSKLTYVTTIGDMGDYAAPAPSTGRGDGYTHSMVFETDVTERLKWVVQSDLVSLNTGGVNHNDEYGVNNYLFYTINDCWAYGNRFEWWKSDSGFTHGGQVAVPPGTHSYFEYTSGLNYIPTPNLRIRPELRADWSPANNFDQTGFGVDVILTF